MTTPYPETTVPIIVANSDHGFAVLDLRPDQQPPRAGRIAVLSLPCPGRNIRGGIGGQMMTPCSWCGEVMASTAGPHSADSRMPKAVVVTHVEGEYVSWRPFMAALAAPPEETAS